MNKWIARATVALFSTTVLVAAQAPQNPNPTTAQRPGTQTPAPAGVTVRSTMTLVGCLYQESQVPGRSPNVAERAGILEDYILADAIIPAEQPQRGAAPGVTGTSGTSGTMLASGNMYKVENIPDERLKTMVGKRVEVTGGIDPEGNAISGGRPGSATGAPTPDRGPGPDQINLPEFEASSIREIPGTCPATPAPRK